MRFTHTDNDDHINNPVACTYCDDNALNGTPFQQAIICDLCGAVICERCNDP